MQQTELCKAGIAVCTSWSRTRYAARATTALVPAELLLQRKHLRQRSTPKLPELIVAGGPSDRRFGHPAVVQCDALYCGGWRN